MKGTVIATAAVAALLLAGSAYADVPAGMQQEGVTLFEQMDEDGDGVVTQSEFEEYSLEEGDKAQLFGVIDQNNDGIISESEWRAYQAGDTGAAVEQPMATEEPMTESGQTSQEERAYGPGVVNKQRQIMREEERGAARGDVWDTQVYDVNDPRKIEPKSRGTANE